MKYSKKKLSRKKHRRRKKLSSKKQKGGSLFTVFGTITKLSSLPFKIPYKIYQYVNNNNGNNGNNGNNNNGNNNPTCNMRKISENNTNIEKLKLFVIDDKVLQNHINNLHIIN